ncbi:L-threonylcarbamoyladenylate synthase [Methanolobus bombayensis]|uniref:L-threonylcarbamoyladenylate synthase n=1 Tax=Methanolobus bombayensis TaxID=38023 RepID=UPI001AE6854E|nr:L-threonylcarbamoyladenylate synthase [Methanolobus bombayensis]MBP1909040.1 L-threonylcarbamoyladenylate synthase [Methanolobus bombayensis]
MKQTKIFYISEKTESEPLDEASKILSQGGTVAFPTETVYGLGANALDEKAVLKIFEAKGRPADNPLIVHVASRDDCRSLVREIPEKASILMDEFWPGPLTIIMERSEIVPDVTTGGLDTVAIRIPENKIAIELIKRSGIPLAAPSANLSGKPSPTSADHVIEDLSGKIDAVVDAGEVIIGLESTVIDLTSDIPAILRPGKIIKEELEEYIGEVRIAYDDKVHPESEIVRSPGMKYTHYSPQAGVILVEGEHSAVVRKIKELLADLNMRDARVGLMLTEESAPFFLGFNSFSIGPREKPEHAAKYLFFGLRNLDSKNVDTIIVDGSFNSAGIGMAVFNRVRKAADMIIKVR